MADVIWLQSRERPPEDRSFALVAADPLPGRVLSDAPVAQGHGVVFYIPDPATEAERSDAIARARIWAERNAVDVIYIEVN
jgi:hypothetical protein